MFVRFRPICRRLAVILIANHREGPKVRQDQIGWLGSVALPEPVGTRERARFWSELDERFRAIAVRRPDRVSAADRDKALALIHARIPKPFAPDSTQGRRRLVKAIGKAETLARNATGERHVAAAETRSKRAGRRAPSRAASTTSARP
jgi:hypothetical protein